MSTIFFYFTFFSRKMLDTQYGPVGTQFSLPRMQIGSLKCLKNPDFAIIHFTNFMRKYSWPVLWWKTSMFKKQIHGHSAKNVLCQGWAIIFSRGLLWEGCVWRRVVPSYGSKSMSQFVASALIFTVRSWGNFRFNDFLKFVCGPLKMLWRATFGPHLLFARPWFMWYFSTVYFCHSDNTSHKYEEKVNEQLLLKQKVFKINTNGTWYKQLSWIFILQ